jgi:Spy/CpxP family protein refolding chaperone
MKLSRARIAVYVLLVFASGAVLGAFGHRLYTVSSVSANKGPGGKSPEEFRKRAVAEYQSRLSLTDQQVSRLNTIMDETRAGVEEARQKMRPVYERIHAEQAEKIREMLTDDQRVEFEKMRKEREERQKQSPRGRF